MGIIEADVGDLMDLTQKSRSDAKKYEWLYHCTTKDAFISMIRTHEMSIGTNMGRAKMAF